MFISESVQCRIRPDPNTSGSEHVRIRIGSFAKLFDRFPEDSIKRLKVHVHKDAAMSFQTILNLQYHNNYTYIHLLMNLKK